MRPSTGRRWTSARRCASGRCTWRRFSATGCGADHLGPVRGVRPDLMMRSVRAASRSFLLAVAVLATFSSACAGRSLKGAGRARQPDSGIAGKALFGPTCPVERPGETCVRPYRATIVIRRETTHRLVARVRSSAQGRFRIALSPGTYLLVPQNGSPYPRSSPQLATVRRHHYTHVVISYDSGIR